MTPQEQWRTELTRIADNIAARLSADIILYHGRIQWSYNHSFIDICEQGPCRENVMLVLVTEGGDAHAAYRIARCLQRTYKRVLVYITGVCKSAGTLVAVGAHEIVMSDHGELGPLDIQMRKRDELWEMSSGLTVMEALTSLQERSFSMFESYFMDLKRNSGGQITLKTAMQIAGELTAGLFSPIYAQVDPMNVGENARAMKISHHYGKLLDAISQNLQEEALEQLIASYPAHDIVIDREEAKRLFKNVRPPTQDEELLARHLQGFARIHIPKSTTDGPIVEFLSGRQAQHKEDTREHQDQRDSASRGQETEAVAGVAGERPPSDNQQGLNTTASPLGKADGQTRL